jgi:Fe-S-cluster-containing hydrogenase component 2
MFFNHETKLPYKCELCKGDPACISICPNDAIVFTNQKPFYSKKEVSAMQAYAFLSKRNVESMSKDE